MSNTEQENWANPTSKVLVGFRLLTEKPRQMPYQHFIGIDISKATIEVAIYQGSQEIRVVTLDNDTKSLESFPMRQACPSAFN